MSGCINIDRRRLLLAGAASLLAGGVPARAGTVRVVIENLAFTPAEIKIRAGQTVEWTNLDRIPHTATVRGGWEVMIPPGATASRQMTAGDGAEYYCRLHPNMKGSIVISG